MRLDGRSADHLRQIKFVRKYNKYAEGSVYVESGETKIICTATIEESVPFFLKNSGKGWITAEYGIASRSTVDRMKREASSGKQGGRTVEIQRLIGRSLRSIIDLEKLGERTIKIDCDVIQADGGTRTNAISGSFVALHDAISWLLERKKLTVSPLKEFCAAISVGIVKGENLLDLIYEEDSKAEVDMNVVMTESGKFIEIQGTAEGDPFSYDQMTGLVALAKKGIDEIISIQKQVLGL